MEDPHPVRSEDPPLVPFLPWSFLLFPCLSRLESARRIESFSPRPRIRMSERVRTKRRFFGRGSRLQPLASPLPKPPLALHSDRGGSLRFSPSSFFPQLGALPTAGLQLPFAACGPWGGWASEAEEAALLSARPAPFAAPPQGRKIARSGASPKNGKLLRRSQPAQLSTKSPPAPLPAPGDPSAGERPRSVWSASSTL